MIEYLYNAIVASAETDIEIVAKVTSAEGAPINSNCNLVLYDNDGAEKYIVNGETVDTNGYWRFIIPADETRGKKNSRLFYCIREGNKPLCFKEPVYLM